MSRPHPFFPSSEKPFGRLLPSADQREDQRQVRIADWTACWLFSLWRLPARLVGRLGVFGRYAAVLLACACLTCEASGEEPEFALFDEAPAGPARSNNTWLNGVWEGVDSNGALWRATLTPASSDLFDVFYERRAKANFPALEGRASGWFTKIGLARFLILRVRENPPGFAVVSYQTLDPLRVRIREVQLPPGIETAKPFDQRMAIRKAFKEGTLFGQRQVVLSKKAEIYWNEEGDPASHTFVPVRNVLPSAEYPPGSLR